VQYPCYTAQSLGETLSATFTRRSTSRSHAKEFLPIARVLAFPFLLRHAVGWEDRQPSYCQWPIGAPGTGERKTCTLLWPKPPRYTDFKSGPPNAILERFDSRDPRLCEI
jgi:hypothetical protein